MPVQQATSGRPGTHAHATTAVNGSNHRAGSNGGVGASAAARPGKPRARREADARQRVNPCLTMGRLFESGAVAIGRPTATSRGAERPRGEPCAVVRPEIDDADARSRGTRDWDAAGRAAP
jgi:hypothetical protein